VFTWGKIGNTNTICHEQCKITDGFPDGHIPSVFYRELKNIYGKYHNHQRLYRQKQSIDILPRVAKYLLQMPQSMMFIPTDTVHWHLPVQFIITDRLCEFQRMGINASLTAWTCRRIAKILKGHLKILVRNLKFTDRLLKIHQ